MCCFHKVEGINCTNNLLNLLIADTLINRVIQFLQIQSLQFCIPAPTNFWFIKPAFCANFILSGKFKDELLVI